MRFVEVRIRGVGATRCQLPGKPVRPGGQNSHGVESAPKADTGIFIGTWEPHSCFFLPLVMEMTKATGDRVNEGRSLRSSQRAGKPSTSQHSARNGRRQAVDTNCKQEIDNMSDTVNTGFILDMQRKLYRWSAANPEKKFADVRATRG